jgi:hypothetical protein
MRTFARFIAESPSTMDLSGLFHQLNHQCFGGVLEDAHIRFGACPRGAAGITRCRITRPGGTRSYATMTQAKTLPGSIDMVIQKKAWTNVELLKGVVAHEMCHAYTMQFNQHEKDGHGRHFLAIRSQAAAKAGFDIPLSDTSDVEDYENPKPVFFICGQHRDGKMYVRLHSPKLANDAQASGVARMNVDRMVNDYKWVWAAIGTASTNLANVMPIARIVAGLKGFYSVKSLKELNIQQMFYTAGTLPASF